MWCIESRIIKEKVLKSIKISSNLLSKAREQNNKNKKVHCAVCIYSLPI